MRVGRLLVFCSGLILVLGSPDFETRTGFKKCQALRIENGIFRQKDRGLTAMIKCNPFFHLLGPKRITCMGGKWSDSTSVCIRPGCNPTEVKLDSLKNGQVRPELGWSKVTVICNEGFETHQPPMIVCNGAKWNGSLPQCFPKDPALSCNFDSDLCGWTQDTEDPDDWNQQQYATTYRDQGYGPARDHSQAGNGQYLYLDGGVVDENRESNFLARLYSPVYSQYLSQPCFSFWYHMYGDSNSGKLRLYLIAYGEKLTETSKPLYEVQGDQGDAWRKHVEFMPLTNKSFLLVFEAVSDKRNTSVIAIDDVNLGRDCNVVANTSSSVPSCKYRCVTDLEQDGAVCSCSIFCGSSGNCCPDYSKYCVLDDNEVGQVSEQAPKEVEISTPLVPVTISTTPASTPQIRANATKSTTTTTTTTTKTTPKAVTITVKPTTATPRTTPSTIKTTVPTARTTLATRPTVPPTIRPTTKTTLRTTTTRAPLTSTKAPSKPTVHATTTTTRVQPTRVEKPIDVPEDKSGGSPKPQSGNSGLTVALFVLLAITIVGVTTVLVRRWRLPYKRDTFANQDVLLLNHDADEPTLDFNLATPKS